MQSLTLNAAISVLLVYLCAGLPTVFAQFFDCSTYAFNKHSRLNAIESGITFTAGVTASFGFDLCFSIGGGGGRHSDESLGFSKPVGAQLDTGSNGVVIPRPTLPAGSYRTTGVCHVFQFDSSLNTYFGEMVFAHVRLFGNDTDGRYLETNAMPLMALEYKCTGAVCLTEITQYNESCSAIRAVMPLPGWVATTVNSTTALVGVGMNRGDKIENYPIGPQPVSRNPMVQLNLDPLEDTLPWYLFEHYSPVPVPSICQSDLSAPTKFSTSGRLCNADPAEPFFNLNARKLISYGYLLTAANIIPVYTYPRSIFPWVPEPSPLTTPIFNCQSLPQLPPAPTPAVFKCFDTSYVGQKVEIFSVNSSQLTSRTHANWTGVGFLLADTGLSYFIDRTPSYPCLNSVTALRMTFPVPPATSSQTNSPFTFTFDVDWRTHTGSGTAVFYKTLRAATTPSQQPPSQMRLWLTNTSTPCQNSNTVQTTGMMNSGRMLYNSFVLYADFVNGVQGYAKATDFAAAFKGHY